MGGLVFGLGGLKGDLGPRLLAGLMYGLLLGLVLGLGGLRPGLVGGLLLGLVFGLGAGLGGGFGAVLRLRLGHEYVGMPLHVLREDLPFATVANPQAVLAADQRMALRQMLKYGLAAGLVFGLASGLVFGLVFGLGAGLRAGLSFGLLFGLVFGLFVSGTQTSWPSYMLTRGWLAYRHRLPWSLMSFLADAHQRGVLRQRGAVYQFWHIELQHRLANRDVSMAAAEDK